MAALTENRYTKHRDGLITAHPVKAETQVFKGSLVCVDSKGYAVPGAAVGGYRFVGIAIENADNSSGNDGDWNVRVQTMGVFSLAHDGSVKQGCVGLTANILDDQTITVKWGDELEGASILCGKVEGLDGDDAWLRIHV